MGENIFSERLRTLRKCQNLTQQELADRLGISASTIGMYEQGRREPDADTLKDISQFFNVSIDYLLGSADDSEGNKELTVMLEEFANELSRYDGLMFDGKDVSKYDREKLIDAIKIAAKIAVDKRL